MAPREPQLTIDGREVITHTLPSKGAKTAQLPLFSAPQTIRGQLDFAQAHLTNDAGCEKHHGSE